MSQRDTFIHAAGGHLHQQFFQLPFVGQVETAPQHSLHHEEIVQVIAALKRPSWHQVVVLVRNRHRLWTFMGYGISVERPGLRIEAHPGIGTHVDCPVEDGIQIFDVETKLILVGFSRCII